MAESLSLHISEVSRVLRDHYCSWGEMEYCIRHAYCSNRLEKDKHTKLVFVPFRKPLFWWMRRSSAFYRHIILQKQHHKKERRNKILWHCIIYIYSLVQNWMLCRTHEMIASQNDNFIPVLTSSAVKMAKKQTRRACLSKSLFNFTPICLLVLQKILPLPDNLFFFLW